MTGTWAAGWATGDIVTASEFKKGLGSISDTTLGGSAASVDITSIVATYAHLMIVVYARSDTAALTATTMMRFNGDTAANYDYQVIQGSAASAAVAETFGATSALTGNMPANTAGANLFGVSTIFVPHYAGSTNNKQIISISGSKSGVLTTNMSAVMTGASWRSNAAINRVTILPSAGSLVTGTRVTIYGMGA